MIVQLQFRHGTTSEWTSTNPILGPGEPGYDTTSRRFKIGDGTTPWNVLRYQSSDLDVTLAITAAAAAEASAAAAAQSLVVTDANAFYNPATATYPTRASVTPLPNRRVRWIGPSAPPIGGGYATDEFDVWEATP